ncbi:hypothetical protein FACS189427_12780 [Planctomycetales bacterium]|nr:hypothetical protein FACS189427_12780 [Planctomycetales bacterium]
MKKTVFVFALLFFIGTLTAAAWRITAVHQQPSLICEEPVFNFGTVNTERILLHEFTVSVQGKRKVKILSVKPGCGSKIEIIDFPKLPLSAGQIGKVKLRLDTKQMYCGQWEHTAVLLSDDSIYPVILKLLVEKPVPAELQGQPVLAPRIHGKH